MSGRDAPNWYVRVGAPRGDLQRVEQSERVLSLQYVDDEKKADKLTLTIDNEDLSHVDSPLWRKGNIVEASWGYPGWMSPIRECVIEKVTGGRRLKVEANGKEMLLHRRQKTRHWANTRRCDVAIYLANEHGYHDDRVWIQATEDTLEQITQSRQTDAVLLRDMARREGFDFYIDWDGLHWHEQKTDQKPQLTLTYFIEPGMGEILDFPNLEDDITADRPGQLRFIGRDLRTKETFEIVVNNANVNRHSLGATVELVGVDDADAAGDPVAENLASEVIVPTTEPTKELARRYAEGVFKRTQLGAVKMTVPVIGIPDLVAKATIRLQGLGPALSGNYYITSVDHRPVAPYKCILKVRRDGKTRVTNPKEDKLPGQGDGVQSEGSQNDQEGQGVGPKAPTPQTVVDPETGQLVTKYLLTPRRILL